MNDVEKPERGKNRNRYLQVRVSEEDIYMLATIAKVLGSNYSTTVRDLIRSAYEKLKGKGLTE